MKQMAILIACLVVGVIALIIFISAPDKNVRVGQAFDKSVVVPKADFSKDERAPWSDKP